MLKPNPFKALPTCSDLKDVYEKDVMHTWRFGSKSDWRVVRDGYPVTEGHTLIYHAYGRRSLFECSTDEIKELHNIMQLVRGHLTDKYGCDGFNIGINEGEAAGQTVALLHVHLIPRRVGDVQDPRGGVRGVIPSKKNYHDWADGSEDICSLDATTTEEINADAPYFPTDLSSTHEQGDR